MEGKIQSTGKSAVAVMTFWIYHLDWTARRHLQFIQSFYVYPFAVNNIKHPCFPFSCKPTLMKCRCRKLPFSDGGDFASHMHSALMLDRANKGHRLCTSSTAALASCRLYRIQHVRSSP